MARQYFTRAFAIGFSKTSKKPRASGRVTAVPRCGACHPKLSCPNRRFYFRDAPRRSRPATDACWAARKRSGGGDSTPFRAVRDRGAQAVDSGQALSIGGCQPVARSPRRRLTDSDRTSDRQVAMPPAGRIAPMIWVCAGGRALHILLALITDRTGLQRRADVRCGHRLRLPGWRRNLAAGSALHASDAVVIAPPGRGRVGCDVHVPFIAAVRLTVGMPHHARRGGICPQAPPGWP